MPRRGSQKPREPKRRGEPVVRKVLEVTLEQLAKHGYERLSVPEVASLAGVNKTSVYRRWPTKSDLVREALHVSMGHGEAPPDTGSLRTDLLALAKAAAAFVESPIGGGVLRTLLAESAPEVRSLARQMLESQQGTEGHRLVFQRAVERGELAADADVRLLLSTVAGALMHRAFVEEQRLSGEYLGALISLVVDGVARRRGAAGAGAPSSPGARRS